MKKVIPLSLMCLLLIGIGQVRAQTAEQPLGFKVAFGVNNYNGDLGNTMGEFHSNDMFYSFGLAYYLGTHFGLALEVSKFTLDKKNGPNDSHFSQRNTHFKTSDFNLSLLLRIKPFDTRLNPYIAVGLAGNWIHDLDNAQVDDSHFLVTVPVGIGINYELSPLISINAQMLYNLGFTDDLIDSYPLSANQAVDGTARSNIDHKDNDSFMLSSIGVVFNFGGGEVHKDHPILAQSMKNLKAAQDASELAADNLRQAQQLNDKTLAALDALRKAQQMDDNDANELKEEFVHIINNIQFAFDKSTILPTAKRELNTLADIINHYPGLQVDLAGHADSRGSQSYNEDLSQRRVQAVKEYLLSHGVSGAQVTTNAYGETQALLSSSNSSADAQTIYAQNRAVQLTLSYHNPQSK